MGRGQVWWPPPASWGTFTTVGQNMSFLPATADDYRHSLNTNLLNHNSVGGLMGGSCSGSHQAETKGIDFPGLWSAGWGRSCWLPSLFRLLARFGPYWLSSCRGAPFPTGCWPGPPSAPHHEGPSIFKANQWTITSLGLGTGPILSLTPSGKRSMQTRLSTCLSLGALAGVQEGKYEQEREQRECETHRHTRKLLEEGWQLAFGELRGGRPGDRPGQNG